MGVNEESDIRRLRWQRDLLLMAVKGLRKIALIASGTPMLTLDALIAMIESDLVYPPEDHPKPLPPTKRRRKGVRRLWHLGGGLH